MGGIPCGGCGDPLCGCCFQDTEQIRRRAGTGNEGDCYELEFVPGAVGAQACDDAVASGALASGDAVLACAGGVLQSKTYEDACDQLGSLPAPVVGPLGDVAIGDVVVVFEPGGCVLKRATSTDCLPSAEPALGPCVEADLEPVFCFSGSNTLKAPPRSITRPADLVMTDWTAALLFFTQGVPVVMATSGIASLTNPSCLYPMTVMLVGEPGHALYTGPSGVIFQVDIEESVNGGAFGGIHSITADYSGQTSAGLTDSHTLPSWNRTFTVAAGGTLTYQWRMILTRLHANVPNINGAVQNFGSRVTMIGGSL